MSCPFNMSHSASADNAGQDGDGALKDGQNAGEQHVMHYRSYLRIDDLLSLQKKVSGEHDEFLFITVHQVFELWFQQVLVELASVQQLLPDAQNVAICVRRLNRVKLLMEHVISQFPLLESMTPLDFREFRDHLAPASGFQSHQFRFIENILGVTPANRVPYNQDNYRRVFDGHSDVLDRFDQTENSPSLFDIVNKWLEDLWGADPEAENFWRLYQMAVQTFVEAKQDEKDRKKARDLFNSVLLKEEHDQRMRRSERRLSHQALQAALLINLYRDQAPYSQPFQVLTHLVDVDVLMTEWRFRHMVTVQRMIGTTTAGTGGSVGYHYLRATLADQYKVFLDLSNLTGFMLPRPLLEAAKTPLKLAMQLDKKL